jgi:type VI secretion system protein ImpC
MAKSFSFGKIELVESTDAAEIPAEMDPETPFHILVLGDFSGRANRRVVEDGSGSVGRRIRIDRDDFDQVMAELGVELRLPVAGDGEAPIVLGFKELDDFHPDRIFEHAEVFQALRETRRRLDDPATAGLLGMRQGPGIEPGQREPIEATPPSPGDLLDQILAQTSGATPPRTPEQGPWDAFLEGITAPHRVPGSDPRQAEMVASVDAATGQLMRDILHHPDFQALEAAWRGLQFLTRRLNTDAQLTVSLLDLTKAELAEDLGSTADLRSTKVYKMLVETSVGQSGGQPWAVLIGELAFEPNRDDVGLLGRLAELARRAGAPFLAAASPRMLGCNSLAATPDPADWVQVPSSEGQEAWDALRRHPDAAYLGLALPRFLLRLPYGKDESPIESFDFEEVLEGSGHDDLLWGNPAFALVELLGRSFGQYGWGLRPGAIREIDGLPLHIDRRSDDPELTPCAEVLLTDRAVEKILAKGLMPLRSIRDRDAIHLARFQSISEPASPLVGRWG